MPIELEESDWRHRARWKLINFDDVPYAQLAQATITMRLEQPYNSTLMVIDDLRKKLAVVASELHIYVSCLCMEGFMVRKWTGNATNSRNAGRLPVRGCCLLHPADGTVKCCGLFFSPDARRSVRWATREQPGAVSNSSARRCLRRITVLGSRHRLRS